MNSRNSSTALLRRTSRWCRTALLGAALALVGTSNAQVTVTNPGNTTPGLSATYTSLADAVTALNAQTAISGPVTITLDPSNPQTAPAGGYIITATLTGASNTNRVTFAGSGNTITASAAHTVGAINDGIIKIHGSDFITISGFTLEENTANTVNTPAGSNTMTEMGIAIVYASTSNGCQGITISGNTIDLSRTYTNTFGIYANSTHTATAYTTSATAVAGGGNNDLTITGNSITDVNQGIVVIGPTGAANMNTGLVIGGSAPNANTITNFGTAVQLSSYANVSGTMNGILVRNSNGYTISHNSISSSTGGVTTGTLRGIFNVGASNTPTGTFTNAINNNSIALTFGGASGTTMNGIHVESGSATTTSTQTINNNNFTALTGSVSTSIPVIAIINASTHQTIEVNSNTFTNLTTNTTGGFTFISNSVSTPTGGIKRVNGNSIVTAFNKTGAGGTVALYTDGGSSVSATSHENNNNNFSNITLTGATTMTGWFNNDGTGSTPGKLMNGNTFNNWTCGTSSVIVLQSNFGNPSSIANNTITNITGQGALTGLLLGSSGTIASLTVGSNTITGVSSTGTGGTVIGLNNTAPATTMNITSNVIGGLSSTSTSSSVSGISSTGGTTVNISKNKVYDLLQSGATTLTPAVNGILITSGTTVNTSNNLIGDLRATATNSNDAIRGISITSTATSSSQNVSFNTIYLNGTSSGTNFGSTGLFHTTSTTATTASLSLRSNIIVNTSTPSGTGNTVAFRRSSGGANTLNNYNSASNNNLFYAGSPAANRLIYADGTSSAQLLSAYKSGVFTAGTIAPRDAASVTEDPPFLSTTGSSSNFLHIDPATPTAVESGGVTVAGITDDFDGNTRSGTPDIGADEGSFTPLPLCSGTPATSTINGAASVCFNTGTNLSLSTNYLDLLITYQWRSGTTSGGPYSTTLGTNATQATGNLTATTYYICEVTCNNGGTFTMTTVEKAVVVNALPTVEINGSAAATGTYCTPGGTPVTLTATGAASYAWSPGSGLSAVTGSPVDASPTSTTTYTVTGTDGNGCVNTATANISVLTNPTGVTATATPATICTGATSNLTSTGLLLAAPNSYTFSGTTGTYAAISGTALANGVGDDTGNGNLPIGFTFNYNGVAQTIFSAGANGLMIMGDPTASYLSGYPFTNALATNANRIAPLWDDNNTTGGSIQYQTTGSPGTRVLTVQWTGMHVGGSGSATNPTINVQVKLYEVDGAIEFHYGATSAALTGTTASIGISGAVGNFLSVTPLSPANTSTVSSVTENTTISSAANFPSGTIYRFAPALPTFSWTSPTNLVSPGSQNTATTPLTATETFTVTVSNGSCSVQANTTVTISPLSCSVATATGPFCAGSNFTVAANRTGGGAPFSYTWSDGVGGIYPDAASITANLPGGTYNFTCLISDACGGSCNSDVTVVVNDNPAPIITPNGSVQFCASGLLTSSIATGNVWSPGGATTQSITVSSGDSYSVTVTDGNGCVGSSAAVVVTINPQPTAVSVTPAGPEVICAGDEIELAVTGGTYTSLVPGNIDFGGSGSSTSPATTGTTLGPNPMQDYYGGSKQQVLYRAADLTAMGLVSGAVINSIAINLSAVDATYNLSNYRVKTQWSNSITALTTTPVSTGWVDQFGPSTVTPAVGFNTFSFSAPITWNGTDNLLIEFNYSNNNGGNPVTGTNVATYALGLGYNATSFYRVDNQTAATLNAYAMTMTAVYAGRNNVRLNASVPTAVPSTYTWSPNGSLTPNSGANVSAAPTTSTTYTVTATAPGGCTSTTQVTVNIDETDTDGDEIIDCVDDCPNFPGVQGDPCDANPGPGFTLGVISGSCTCEAIPCTETVSVDLRTDANSQQASWEILAQNTNLVICSGGSYPTNITTPIVEDCCLPVGCYRLRVMDSGGDGFVTGGYQLRESGLNGRRIIDNFGNFTTGSASAIAATYENGAFCVPIGDDKLIFSSCDKLDWVANKFIVASANPAVSAEFGVTNATSGYEFWFFDPNGSFSYRRFRSHATSDGFGTGATRACHFKVNGWFQNVNNPYLPSDVLLNVRVRGRVAGNNLPFGPACLFKIDATLAACPRVKLQDDPSNTSDFSCGVFRNFGGTGNAGNRIYANPPQPIPAVSSANVRYQFRFRIPGENICIVRPPQTSAQLTMNWTTGQLLECSKTYEVDVRVSLNGGATWCFGPATSDAAAACADTEAWGKVCNVTINACALPNGGGNNMVVENNNTFTMYPNPNRGDQLFLSVSSVEEGVNTVSVDIFDLTGKRVMARTIAVQDGFINTNLELNGDLAGGLYVVNVTAGTKAYTERLVIQP